MKSETKPSRKASKGYYFRIGLGTFLVSGFALVWAVSAQQKPEPNEEAVEVSPLSVQLQPVLSGLSSPVLVTNARDGSNRLFIVEQGGIIKVCQPGSTTPTVFLNITPKVLSGGERGLLGLAFHPEYSVNRRFFVNYTRQTDGATVIAEYKVSISNPNIADTAEVVFLTIAQPFANHNGGMIEFGNDGFLYIGMGDGGSGNDPGNRAQNKDDLLGKILRIDIDVPNGGIPYSSPPDNPFFGLIAGRDEIYALGMRNPFRFSFDRPTGQLYVGDVGQGLWEEVDIVTLGGNYGWRVFEGAHCTNLDPTLCGLAGFTPPITEYAHTVGRCSITGGHVYRGSSGTLPVGAYIFGDFCTGELFILHQGNQTLLLDTSLSIASFGEDEAGEIYVVGLGGTVNRIGNTTPQTLQGTHDSAGCGTITGWAWNSSDASSTINVDIYDGQTLIGSAPANLFREDLVNAGIGNGFHGFSFTVPSSLKDGTVHSIRARFGGTAIDLLNTPRVINCSNTPPVYQGFHDGAGCNTISGWAWDVNDPNNPINVDIYDGTTLLATLSSTQFRPDLVSAGIGNGFHGFSFTLPASLKDGQLHSIRVRFPNGGASLGNTPRTIGCSGLPFAAQGYHDGATCNVINGWAWDANDPNSPINVAIYDGTQLVATVLAIQFRQDLVNAGIGNGYHGFSFNTPANLRDGNFHAIRVRFSGTTTSLSNTPRTINCPP